MELPGHPRIPFLSPRGRRKSAYPAAKRRHEHGGQEISPGVCGCGKSAQHIERAVHRRAGQDASAAQREQRKHHADGTRADDLCRRLPRSGSAEEVQRMYQPKRQRREPHRTPRPPRHKRAEQEPPEEDLLQHPCAEHGAAAIAVSGHDTRPSPPSRLHASTAASGAYQSTRRAGTLGRQSPSVRRRPPLPLQPSSAAMKSAASQRITAVRRAQPLAQPVTEPHRKHIRRDAYKRKAQRIPPVDQRQHQPITHGASLSRTRPSCTVICRPLMRSV